MHPLLIDWLRRIHFDADAGLAARRWSLAEAAAQKLTRQDVVQFLRMFLIPSAAQQLTPGLTQLFLKIDNEFPASKNTEEVRLMTGVTMVAAFARRSVEADAFALGIVAGSFPPKRCKAAHAGIVQESSSYLASEADGVRPALFGTPGDRQTIKSRLHSFAESVKLVDGTSNDEPIEELTEALDRAYGKQLQRLAEESALLWWLLAAYSPTLDQAVSGLDAKSYALIAADEAAGRVQVLPPPPSMHAILGRVLSHCKGSTGRKLRITDIVAAANTDWRRAFVANYAAADCADLVPLTTALVKTENAGTSDVLMRALPAACPGVAADSVLSPADASRQLFDELMFLKALAGLD